MLVLSIVQAFATLTGGIIIGIIYIWKLGLVGFGISHRTFRDRVYIETDFDIACIPLLMSTGYTRLVCCLG